MDKKNYIRRIVISSLYFAVVLITAFYILIDQESFESNSELFLSLKMMVFVAVFFFIYEWYLFKKLHIRQDFSELVLIFELAGAWTITAFITYKEGVIWGVITFVVLSLVAWLYVKYLKIGFNLDKK